jgi:hypothetical protein
MEGMIILLSVLPEAILSKFGLYHPLHHSHVPRTEESEMNQERISSEGSTTPDVNRCGTHSTSNRGTQSITEMGRQQSTRRSR